MYCLVNCTHALDNLLLIYTHSKKLLCDLCGLSAYLGSLSGFNQGERS